jgi:hypothetical protein
MINRVCRRTLTLTAALVLAVLATPGSLQADETFYCDGYVTSLPFTISTQGHWCLDHNLSTGITAGAAITINSNFVVLDLNGFKVGGGSAGPATTAAGVFATGRQNLVIRNGNIRGFHTAVRIEGSTSKAVFIEDLRLDENTTDGIALIGANHVVRRNTISDTGGNTIGQVVRGIGGIAATNNLQLIDNAVIHTFENSTANGDPDAINVLGGGTSILIIGNRIVDATDDGIAAGGSICKDNIVTGQGGTAISCTFEVGTTDFP